MADDPDETDHDRLRIQQRRMMHLHALLHEQQDRPGVWTAYAWAADAALRLHTWCHQRALAAITRRWK